MLRVQFPVIGINHLGPVVGSSSVQMSRDPFGRKTNFRPMAKTVNSNSFSLQMGDSLPMERMLQTLWLSDRCLHSFPSNTFPRDCSTRRTHGISWKAELQMASQPDQFRLATYWPALTTKPPQPVLLASENVRTSILGKGLQIGLEDKLEKFSRQKLSSSRASRGNCILVLMLLALFARPYKWRVRSRAMGPRARLIEIRDPVDREICLAVTGWGCPVC